MLFVRPLLEFGRLLLLAGLLIFLVGFAVEHTPPPVGLVAGVSVAALSLGGIAVLLLRGVLVRRAPRPESPVTHEEEHEHPVLGRYTTYVRDGVAGNWSCKVASKVLGCEVNLWGKTPEPTEAEVERWTELERKLPAILADIPPPYDDDGWGHAPGTFTPSKPKRIKVLMRDDAGFLIFPDLVSSDDYMLGPIIDVEPDGEVRCEGWSC